MTKTLLALTLTLTAASTSAANWPWQDPAPQEPPQYCMGFVVGGLASNVVSSTSRTDLWLAWSYIIRSDVMSQAPIPEEYQAGKEKFANVADASAAVAVLQSADGECGLGRSGHEITGW